MRLSGLTLSSIMIFFACGSALALADPNPIKEPAKDEDSDDLDLVPLVNLNAPLVIVWTSEKDDVPIEDATAVDSQLFDDMSTRRDIRLFSREKTLKIVDGSGDKRLMHCKWEDPCLVGIAKLAKADMVIGVKLTGTKDQYFLAFKRIQLGDKPGKVMKIASGKLSALLVGGIAKAIESVLTTKPVPLKSLPDIPHEKAQAPSPISPAKNAPSTKETEALDHPGLKTTNVAKVPVKAPTAQIFVPSPIDEMPRHTETPGFFNRHIGSTIATGLGLALAGSGIGFGLAANSAQRDVEFQWDPSTDDSGRANALTANILFGLSGVSIIVAVVLFVIEPSSKDYHLSVNTNEAVAAFSF